MQAHPSALHWHHHAIDKAQMGSITYACTQLINSPTDKLTAAEKLSHVRATLLQQVCDSIRLCMPLGLNIRCGYMLEDVILVNNAFYC